MAKGVGVNLLGERETILSQFAKIAVATTPTKPITATTIGVLSALAILALYGVNRLAGRARAG